MYREDDDVSEADDGKVTLTLRVPRYFVDWLEEQAIDDLTTAAGVHFNLLHATYKKYKLDKQKEIDRSIRRYRMLNPNPVGRPKKL